MLTLTNAVPVELLKSCGELPVKGKKCLVLDPSPQAIKVKLLWLPRHLQKKRRVAEAFQQYGTVQNITREKWGMENIETLSRIVTLTLHERIVVDQLPHLLNVYGCQTLLLIPGRPPLCLRCNRVGHIRRYCRVPRCAKCRRYGHEAPDCMTTYATALQGPLGDAEGIAAEHLMDASEVADVSGVPAPPTGEVAEHIEPGALLIQSLEFEIAAEGTSKSLSEPASSLDVSAHGPETAHAPEAVVPQVALEPVCASPPFLSCLTPQKEMVAAAENPAPIRVGMEVKHMAPEVECLAKESTITTFDHHSLVALFLGDNSVGKTALPPHISLLPSLVSDATPRVARMVAWNSHGDLRQQGRIGGKTKAA